jgi:hypothetical protein
MHKISKANTHYSVGQQNLHCGRAFGGDKSYCRHFIEPPTGAADLGAMRESQRGD